MIYYQVSSSSENNDFVGYATYVSVTVSSILIGNEIDV